MFWNKEVKLVWRLASLNVWNTGPTSSVDIFLPWKVCGTCQNRLQSSNLPISETIELTQFAHESVTSSNRTSAKAWHCPPSHLKQLSKNIHLIKVSAPMPVAPGKGRTTPREPPMGPSCGPNEADGVPKNKKWIRREVYHEVSLESVSQTPLTQETPNIRQEMCPIQKAFGRTSLQVQPLQNTSAEIPWQRESTDKHWPPDPVCLTLVCWARIFVRCTCFLVSKFLFLNSDLQLWFDSTGYKTHLNRPNLPAHQAWSAKPSDSQKGPRSQLESRLKTFSRFFAKPFPLKASKEKVFLVPKKTHWWNSPSSLTISPVSKSKMQWLLSRHQANTKVPSKPLHSIQDFEMLRFPARSAASRCASFLLLRQALVIPKIKIARDFANFAP